MSLAVSMSTGVIFNIQRFSIHDGPGIRSTVFFKGCPLSCWWCHNPESRDARPVLSILPDRCIECESCVEVCPVGRAGPIGKGTDGARGVCQRCGHCAEACPSGARTMIGRSYTVQELMLELDKDEIFYAESGGGITFSGGEPAMPPRNSRFLLTCLESCRQRGYHRAVDTSGCVPWETLRQIAQMTDLFLYDIKHMDDAMHRRYVGVSNLTILENLRSLSREGANVWIRVPLVPGINDDERNIDETARFVASLESPYPVHLLPYHAVGSDKYRRLGKSYSLEALEPPEVERTKSLAGRMRSFGLEVKIGG